jgi:hypothetical protein
MALEESDRSSWKRDRKYQVNVLAAAWCAPIGCIPDRPSIA